MNEVSPNPESLQPEFRRGSVVLIATFDNPDTRSVVLRKLSDKHSETAVIVQNEPDTAPTLALPGTSRNQDMRPTHDPLWTEQQITEAQHRFLDPS
jgi:predicted kinase